MVEQRKPESLKALYVVGANPLAHFGTFGSGRGKLELLIVHEMFLTETRRWRTSFFQQLRHTRKTEQSQTLLAKSKCCTRARK